MTQRRHYRTAMLTGVFTVLCRQAEGTCSAPVDAARMPPAHDRADLTLVICVFAPNVIRVLGSRPHRLSTTGVASAVRSTRTRARRPFRDPAPRVHAADPRRQQCRRKQTHRTSRSERAARVAIGARDPCARRAQHTRNPALSRTDFIVALTTRSDAYSNTRTQGPLRSNGGPAFSHDLRNIAFVDDFDCTGDAKRTLSDTHARFTATL